MLRRAATHKPHFSITLFQKVFMVFRMRKSIWIFIALLIALGMALSVLPSKPWIEARIKSALQAQGFAQTELSLSEVGLTSSVLNNVNLGGNPPLVLKNVTLRYSFFDLLSRRIRSAVLDGLLLDLRKEENVWRIAGFPQNEKTKTPFFFPVTADSLNALPFENIDIKNSRAHIATDLWQLDLPIDFVFQTQPAEFHYAATGLALNSGGMNAKTGEAKMNAMLKEDHWEGEWTIAQIETTGAPQPLPPVNASGSFALRADRVFIEGHAQDSEKAHLADFEIDYNLSSPVRSSLLIKDGAMPWNGGKISTQNARLFFAAKEPTSFDLKIAGVSADALIQQFTGKRASATGALSGTIPVTIAPGGVLAFHNGKLYAEGPGTIALSPEVVSGANEQLALVRNVLQDFRYTSLSVDLDSSDGGLHMLMKLEGSNPKVQQGRPVKLNVNLKGDVLGFIQQNLLWLNDPRKLLERGIHENP